MSTGLLRLKTYVELRDVVKFNRVAARLAKKGVDGLIKEIGARKKGILEKVPQKGAGSGSSGSTPSRSKTKRGNQDHMELDMWERVEAPTSTAPQWGSMIAEMMIKDAEWQ